MVAITRDGYWRVSGSLSRAVWVGVRGLHGAEGVVHFPVVALVSTDCQDHIPHHRTFLQSATREWILSVTIIL